MAEQDTRKKLPTLPQNHWWTLRRKFKQSIPGVVTDTYLASVLETSALSARTNVMPALRALHIIESSGKPTDRAKQWRDDESYKAVCEAIVGEIYPTELVDAVPDPWNSPGKAEKWIANHTGTGENASGKMAALYAILMRADASPGLKEKEKTVSKKSAKASDGKPPSKASPPQDAVPSVIKSNIEKQNPNPKVPPAINLNLQIHISADASPDQIEKIFSSMAKHIYKDA